MPQVAEQPPRRARSNPRRRRVEIIEAAARVFAEHGFHGASTQDIADVLGIRQASLYYYFASKEAALEEVCTRGVEGFFETASAIAAGSEPAPAKIRRLVEAHLAPLIDRRDFVKVFLDERQHLPPDSRRRIGKWSRAYERVIEGVIRAGVAAGELRPDLDPRLATLGLLGMVKSVAAWHGREPNAALDRVATEFSRLLLYGMSKDARRLSKG